ncbi:TPA: hypothetical protein JIN69_003767, partial [Acinetobacter baumannii]|nr:hypothetical protein [Acinetobacter baumannii]HAV7155123.1 hypothetical protein [Acinetobacter baumannii]HEE6642637.1 hypothetical protein [Acinetobacter baumannii]
ERLSKAKTTPLLTGEWMTIKWTPDPTTRECFNLGVVLKTENEIFVRTIDGDSFNRFSCMFGEEMKFHAQRITKLAESWANEGCLELSSQLIFDNHGFIRGKSGSQLIDHLFDIAVPLGRPIIAKKRKNSGFNAFNFQQLSNSLLDELKRQDHDGFSFNKLIPSSRYIEINNQNIHAPLRPVDSDAVGNWASVVFSDPARIRIDYLQAINDLRTASDHLKKKPYLFILKPDSDNLEHLTPYRIEQIDEIVDKLDSTLKPQGIELYSSTSLEGLASEIYGWEKEVA